MDKVMFLLFAAAAIYQVCAQGLLPHVTCPRTFSKLGCFKEKATTMDMMVNDRDKTSPYYQGYFLNWKEFQESVHSLACRCAAKAKSLGYAYMAIRFWGECYAGKNEADLAALTEDPARKSNQCVSPKFTACVDSDEEECIGKAFADYIYSLSSKAEIDVDGGYSDWSEYSACSSTCGNGIETRERTCTNPVPKGAGKDCTDHGESTETRACKIVECPVNGGFTPWTEYEECDKSCGGGTQTRTRSCTDPAPAHGGEECHGPTFESRDCNLNLCPVNGGYGPWGEYNTCSVTCGGGLQSRSRQCDSPTPSNGGDDCTKLGPSVETITCNMQTCPPRYGPEINNMVCESARVELNCADGVIEVISANYGRTSRIYCGYLFWWQLNCHSSTSSSKMAELCNGRNSCIVQAANSVFGDPCVGTVKYLDVRHRCKFSA